VAVVTIAVVGIIIILEIIVENCNQIMNPKRRAVLVEETLAYPMVVVMDLVIDVVDTVAEGFCLVFW
jgi:hypothetical protein